MTEQEIVLSHIMDLTFAIQNDDLETAKVDINYLNSICDKETHIEYYNLLQDNNPLKILGNRKFFNLSYRYTLKNLTHIINKLDYEWMIILYDLETDRNITLFNDIIKSFSHEESTFNLNEYINSLGFLKIKFDLIKLCYFYQDYDNLEKIKQIKE